MQLFCNVLLVGISTALVLDRNLKLVFIDGFLPFPNGTVPYVIIDGLGSERIVQPMLDIAKWSTGCITFRPKIDSDKRYLWIRPATEDRCDTVPGSEIVLIVIGPHCMFGSILHALMHGLGFGHEHSRPDRDQYIKVNLENVQADLWDQFNISAKYWTLTPYDYKSIMHYGRFAHIIPSAKDETIHIFGDIDEEPDDFHLMGQRAELSNWDKIALTDYCSFTAPTAVWIINFFTYTYREKSLNLSEAINCLIQMKTHTKFQLNSADRFGPAVGAHTKKFSVTYTDSSTFG